MDGERHILRMALTDTCKPPETQPLLMELSLRGIRPKVVYVDDECCGAWPAILHQIWPGVHVRLDGMHAIARLARTTSSTQHPWHGRFCGMLAESIYTHNKQIAESLKEARAREGLGHTLPKTVRNNYVPRVITNAEKIVSAIDAVMAHFRESVHPQMGPLLTTTTEDAWAKLKKHVAAGCLCDPPDVALQCFGDSVTIGGRVFRSVVTKRGASALEGFHAHQKRWFGPFAHFAAEAANALLSDGALRWNRKRHNEATDSANSIPCVFEKELLHSIDELHQRLLGERLYPTLIRREAARAAPLQGGHLDS